MLNGSRRFLEKIMFNSLFTSVFVNASSVSILFLKTLLILTKCEGVFWWGNSLNTRLWNRRKRVRTPIALICLLSDKYLWEKYEPPHPPSNGLNSTTIVLLEGWFQH